MQIAYETQDVSKNEVCTLCEQYTGQAIDYLKQNKTQTEIIELLHQSCSQLHSFKLQARYFSIWIDDFVEKCELK